MISELTRTWTHGWTVSRRTPPPVERPWGLSIEVGAEGHMLRHVVPSAEGDAIRAAAEAAPGPDAWLKIPAEPREVWPFLPPGWVVVEEDPGHLMAADLCETGPAAPEGYAASVEVCDGVTFVVVRDAAGERAARGQAAVVGEAAIVDQVVTEEAHRRRGLGAFVMRTLADRAVAEGAVLGILGATDAGRALYETLGWKAHAGLTGCTRRAQPGGSS
ncbi:GNAT family N-acetyltransferase [Streptomyces sp. ODS28]|uniref:GNAT family N-acetyltransferase n=1 Tax=Streptomyces sp. ODS28 TaxID=3136688 RepID=UPI0031F04A89